LLARNATGKGKLGAVVKSLPASLTSALKQSYKICQAQLDSTGNNRSRFKEVCINRWLGLCEVIGNLSSKGTDKNFASR
jgi:hypothetical protein